MDLWGDQKYFNFEKHKYGPYDHSIEIVSRKIKEFQKYYNVKSTSEAYDIAYKKLTSETVNAKLDVLIPLIEKATNYVNRIESDTALECITTILFILEKNGGSTEGELVKEFKAWSEDKAERINEDVIIWGINYLYETEVIEKSLIGYNIILANSK